MAKQTNPTQPVNTGNQPFDQVCQNTQNWNMEAGSQDITSKDLGTIQDEMYHEALAYKKFSVYSQYFTDPQLKDMANRGAQHHKQHFDALQNYLNSRQ